MSVRSPSRLVALLIGLAAALTVFGAVTACGSSERSAAPNEVPVAASSPPDDRGTTQRVEQPTVAPALPLATPATSTASPATPTATPAMQQCVDECRVGVGEQFEVVIQGDPASGAWWDVLNEASLENVVLLRQEFVAPTAGVVGIGRAQTFTFAAVRRGSETIEFEHRHAGDADSALAGMNLIVTVDE